MKDADGNITTYGYDSEGNLTSITPPSPQQAMTYTYDGLSRIATETDGNGNVATYTYTPLNRVKSVSYKDSSGGSTSSVTYTYDPDGNQTSVVDSVTGTTTYTYDTLNRQTKKTLPDTSTISYTYDAVGNLLTLTDAGGKVTYGYDNLNEMTSLTEPNGSGGTETLTFTYDTNGRRVSMQYPQDPYTGGTATYYIYDNGGRLQELTRYGQYTDDEDYVYSYSNPNGPSGNSTSLRYSVNSYLNTPQGTGQQWTTSYSYDPLNRLTGATTTTVQGTAYATTSTYHYDANGNRTSGSTSANSGTSILNPYNNTYTYGSANELTKVNSTTCSNDANGNQTGCGTSYSESYNPRNQTTSMSSPNGSLSMSYIGTDSTERTQAGSTPYTYNLLGMGTEKDSSGNIIAYTRDSSGNLIGERTKGGNYFYLFDGLGSVVALISAKTDAVVSTYIYDPYGVVEQQSGTQYNPWQFAGGYYDATMLYEKFGTRYYDRFGRWTQQDPVASANPYAYANDDPVNMVDSGGMSSCFVTILSDISAAAFYGGLYSLGFTILAASAESIVTIPLLYLYVIYVTPVLVLIEANLLNDAFEACGLPPPVQFNG